MYTRTSSGAVVALIPKAGMQSMRYALRSPLISLEEARAAEVRVIFLRDPARRIVSAYRFFKTIYEDYGFTPCPNSPQKADVVSWDAFITYIRTKPDDPHWRPQIEIVKEFAPTAIHKFEEIDQHWSKYHDVVFPHLNSSKPYEVGEIPTDIMALYAEEAALVL